MIYDVKNSQGKMLVDCRGTVIGAARMFNEETEEAEILLIGTKNKKAYSVVDSNLQALTVTVKIPGAKIVDRF